MLCNRRNVDKTVPFSVVFLDFGREGRIGFEGSFQ